MSYLRILHFLAAILLAVSVKAEVEDSMSIGQRFHYETNTDADGFKGKAVMGKDVPLYKEYSGSKKVSLPKPSAGSITLEQAIQSRKSTRFYSEKSVTLGQLSRLLLSADGITHSYGKYAMRSAPSGGALYPVDIYVVAGNVDSLQAGLYHFQISDSSLELVKEGDLRKNLCRAAHEQDMVEGAQLNFILTARWDRSTKKYADRGYRYTYMEVGAICENIYLQAAALGLGTVAVGAYDDDAVNKLLGVDGKDESSVLIMPIGVLK